MMQKLKLIISAALLIFMFLPLSQCSTVEEPGAVQDGTVATEPAEPDKFVPIEQFEIDLASGLFMLGSFILPLVSCFIKPKRFKFAVAGNLFQISVAAGFIYLVMGWVYSELYTPLIAGHVLMALIVIFLLLSLATLIALVRDKHNPPFP